jgi:hypothetical protein
MRNGASPEDGPQVTGADLGPPYRIWVKSRIPGTAWQAWGVFLADRRRWHLAELRIAPYAQSATPPTITSPAWVDSLDALSELPEPQEIYARLLRLLPLAAMRQAASDFGSRVASITTFSADGRPPRSYGEGLPDPKAPTDSALRALEVAVNYLQVIEDGKRAPLVVVAKRLGLRDSTIARDRLKAARRAGFLTDAGPGRAGGQLTDLGDTLARQYLTKAHRLRKGRATP